MPLRTLILAALALAMPALASAQGPMYAVNVRGVPMSCTSAFGEPVAIFLDETLGDVGMASRTWSGQPTIRINPRVVARHSDLVAQWWFAHECAHHALPPATNSETNADCFAVRQLVATGLLRSPQQLTAFQWELGHLPGSPMGHLPGPWRVQNIAACAM